MPSPFRGMDPYLENSGDWPDFHARFINYLADAIGERAPERYDVRIARHSRVGSTTLDFEERPDRFIEIFKRPGRSLITVVELLSPCNKGGADRRDSLTKRSVLMHQKVHQVELDLLIQGHRVLVGGPLPPGDYYAIVSRSDDWPDSQVYAWTLRQPLPTLPVPLCDPDPDVWVDLSQVFATTYERGRYGRSLIYNQAPVVALSAEDRHWATERGTSATLG